MSKMHYFSDKFSKIAINWPLTFDFVEVARFGQIVVFQTNYD